jgi:hypothetical protein
MPNYKITLSERYKLCNIAKRERESFVGKTDGDQRGNSILCSPTFEIKSVDNSWGR